VIKEVVNENRELHAVNFGLFGMEESGRENVSKNKH
jgi:hypothetical protein